MSCRGLQCTEVKEEGLAANDESWSWTAAQPEVRALRSRIHRVCLEKVGVSAIDFSAKSYIALKKGRRAGHLCGREDKELTWYIPGAQEAAITPTDFYARVKDTLAPLGAEPSWSFKLQMLGNPIAFNLTPNMLGHSKTLNSSVRHTLLPNRFRASPAGPNRTR